MDRKLPNRPSLEHLRGQAKGLVAALRAGDRQAARRVKESLPGAAKRSLEEILAAPPRLSGAQSVIAREHGHASWPRLVRHVEMLVALEGTWGFARLVVEGEEVPAEALGTSRIVIDGYRFRTISPEATYDGVLSIDAEADPPTLDVDFVGGPEAGERSLGIFTLAQGWLLLCLGLTGAPRPTAFESAPASGHALETLVRTSGAHAIPPGNADPAASALPAGEPVDEALFHELTPAFEPLQGTWTAVGVLRDGLELPPRFLAAGRRTMEGTRTTVRFGAHLQLDALTRLDPRADPLAVDYLHVGDAKPGPLQLGILRLVDGELESCLAPPGAPRPTAFEAPAGSGWTWSRWKRAR